MNDSIAYVNEDSTIKANISRTVRDTKMTRSTFGYISVFFYTQKLTEIEAVAGCTFACICNTVFRMFSCLQINCQPFFLRQLLKFHPFNWLIKIYLQTEGHSQQMYAPTNGWFSPLFLEVLPCSPAFVKFMRWCSSIGWKTCS